MPSFCASWVCVISRRPRTSRRNSSGKSSTVNVFIGAAPQRQRPGSHRGASERLIPALNEFLIAKEIPGRTELIVVPVEKPANAFVMAAKVFELEHGANLLCEKEGAEIRRRTRLGAPAGSG